MNSLRLIKQFRYLLFLQTTFLNKVRIFFHIAFHPTFCADNSQHALICSSLKCIASLWAYAFHSVYTRKKKLEMWETFNAVKWDKVCLNTEWAESNEYLVYIKLSTLTMATDMHLDRIVKSLCFIYCYYHHNHWTWSILLCFFLLRVGEKIEKYFVPHMKKKVWSFEIQRDLSIYLLSTFIKWNSISFKFNL